jgi:CHAT domain-containing protein
MPGLGAGFAIGTRPRKPVDTPWMGLIVNPAAEDLDETLFDTARETLKNSLIALSNANAMDLLATKNGKATVDMYNRLSGVCELLHILAHGDDRNWADPLRSGLLLSDGDAPRSLLAGANLFASDVMARPVRASHVTLQACSLGRLRSGPDGELWGLARAMLSSGADTVIAPLWDVDIRSSTALFSDTYRRMAEDPAMPIWEAFTAAQREMASRPHDDPWSHVYHWGAFRLISGCTPEPADAA